ncbi:MAG: hypothetical protein KKD39_05975 [Candidatus Altiarchaeota archaeon]|nr:hypothetical protein [Candidatus Altiarchaeota archaeon]
MDSTNPRSVGQLVEDWGETASIVNSKGVQFKLGKNAVWIWKTCSSSISRQKLMKGYAKAFNLQQKEVESTVDAILKNLEKIELINPNGN